VSGAFGTAGSDFSEINTKIRKNADFCIYFLSECPQDMVNKFIRL
jgi:hypothetical protein